MNLTDIFGGDNGDDNLLDAPPDTPPKRGRGRPPKDPNAPKVDRAPRRMSKTWVREQVAGLDGGLNMAVIFSPYAEDALNEQEMDLLTDALSAECMSSERVMSWMAKAGAITPHILLLRAVGIIAYPRLARRGLVPSFAATEAPPESESSDPYPFPPNDAPVNPYPFSANGIQTEEHAPTV